MYYDILQFSVECLHTSYNMIIVVNTYWTVTMPNTGPHSHKYTYIHIQLHMCVQKTYTVVHAHAPTKIYMQSLKLKTYSKQTLCHHLNNFDHIFTPKVPKNGVAWFDATSFSIVNVVVWSVKTVLKTLIAKNQIRSHCTWGKLCIFYTL